MARLEMNAITQWITAAALRRPDTLDLELAARTGASRRTARRVLARLVEMNWLVRSGSPRRPHWEPGAMRQVVQRYALAGLEEDTAWSLDFAACFALPHELRRLVQHTFCELVNNAIDHSGGTQLTVSLRQTGTQVQLLVSDNGLGLFQQIAQTFAIASPALAMLELSKGKLTSQPQRHTGQGLFFASRLADVFDLRANGAAFQQRGWDAQGWHPQRGLPNPGTSAYAAFALDTPRTVDAVRRVWSLDGVGVDFERTSVPLQLATSEREGLESRAQARRGARAARRVPLRRGRLRGRAGDRPCVRGRAVPRARAEPARPGAAAGQHDAGGGRDGREHHRISNARKSLTFVKVGPGTTRSPSGLKKL